MTDGYYGMYIKFLEEAKRASNNKELIKRVTIYKKTLIDKLEESKDKTWRSEIMKSVIKIAISITASLAVVTAIAGCGDSAKAENKLLNQPSTKSVATKPMETKPAITKTETKEDGTKVSTLTDGSTMTVSSTGEVTVTTQTGEQKTYGSVSSYDEVATREVESKNEAIKAENNAALEYAKEETRTENSTSSSSSDQNINTSAPSEQSDPSEPSEPTHTHAFRTETSIIHHDEEGHFVSVQVGTRTVVDQEAYDETESVDAPYEQFGCGFRTSCYISPGLENRNPDYYAKLIRAQQAGCPIVDTKTCRAELTDHALNHNCGVGNSKMLYDTFTYVVAHHDAVTHEEPVYEDKWVVDREAYDETVTHQVCDCGEER